MCLEFFYWAAGRSSILSHDEESPYSLAIKRLLLVELFIRNQRFNQEVEAEGNNWPDIPAARLA